MATPLVLVGVAGAKASHLIRLWIEMKHRDGRFTSVAGVWSVVGTRRRAAACLVNRFCTPSVRYAVYITSVDKLCHNNLHNIH